jgi:pimeloyl-ACP methyl ester carboxylesterase
MNRDPSEIGTVASADGVPIRYAVSGAGEPALVFVHCWTGDRRFWDAQVACFAPRHRVVALDLAGHAESGRERRAWTIPAFGEDVRAVVERLALSRVILVGHSMGGTVILEAARRLGPRVVGLIPVDTLRNVERRWEPGEMETMLADFRADFAGSVPRFIRERLIAPATDPRVIERILAQVLAAPREMAIPAIEATWRYDAAAAFREITTPIVAVNGDLQPTDVAVNRRHAPQFEALIMKGVGHFPMLEEPALFNELLADAIARVVAAADRAAA